MENDGKKKHNKKRERDNNNDDDMDIDEGENDFNLENQIEGENENVEFDFSNILEKDYHSIKTLLQPMFQFENINVGELADFLISQHEDVGTTIRSDEQVFAVFSYVAFSSNLQKKKHLKFFDEFYNYLKLKANNMDENNKTKIINIIENQKNNIGLIISERVINLPEETVPPALGLATKEINECREVEDKEYDKRFDFDYLILISKYVKILENDSNKGKKMKMDEKFDEYKGEAYYKFEAPLFLKKAVATIDYKIPYKERQMELIENSKQPQYVKIIFMKADDYYNTIQKELGCKFE